MKQLASFIVVTLGFLVFEAGTLYAASMNAMTVRFNFTGAIREPTRFVATSTVTNYTFEVTKIRFSNKDMLKLLAAEFTGSTFPDGAQLGLSVGFEFVVLDKTGNIFLNVSSNLADSSYVFNITTDYSAATLVGKDSRTATVTTRIVTRSIPDFTVYYADGKGNKFHFGGLASIRSNVSATEAVTTFKSTSLSVPACSGGGTIFNGADFRYDPVVLNGNWSASGTGLKQFLR